MSGSSAGLELTWGTVARSAVQLLASGELQAHLLASLERAAIGSAAGLSLGLALGLALGLSRRVEAWIGPFFRTLAQVPNVRRHQPKA